MTRSRMEPALAVLFAAGIILAGAVVLTFVYTISPVHTDPGAVSSTAAEVSGAGRLRDEGGEHADWEAVPDLARQSYRGPYAALRAPDGQRVGTR